MIEAGKIYKDGYGRDVRILTTEAKRAFDPVVGLVRVDGGELVELYRLDGTIYPMRDSRKNLIITETFVRLQDVKDALAQSGNVMAAQSLVDEITTRELPIR
jgi:hypothetical protein